MVLPLEKLTLVEEEKKEIMLLFTIYLLITDSVKQELKNIYKLHRVEKFWIV